MWLYLKANFGKTTRVRALFIVPSLIGNTRRFYLPLILLMIDIADCMENKNEKHIVSIATFAFAFFILANVSYAEQKGTSLDAHVHGLSQLTIAVEGEKLSLSFLPQQ